MPIERASQGFKDVSMSFGRNPINDDVITIKDRNAIARSLRNIVFTRPGEKFFNPNFWCIFNQIHSIRNCIM